MSAVADSAFEILAKLKQEGFASGVQKSHNSDKAWQ
jgi:hypothetical protein